MKKRVVVRVCDLCGEEAEEQFRVGHGRRAAVDYDLCTEHAKPLLELITHPGGGRLRKPRRVVDERTLEKRVKK